MFNRAYRTPKLRPRALKTVSSKVRHLKYKKAYRRLCMPSLCYHSNLCFLFCLFVVSRREEDARGDAVGRAYGEEENGVSDLNVGLEAEPRR